MNLMQIFLYLNIQFIQGIFRYYCRVSIRSDTFSNRMDDQSGVIPMDQAAAIYRNISQEQEKENSYRPDSVLLLDPSAEDRQKVNDLFTRNGYRVFTAGSLGEALEVIVRHKPDVIFTEIVFPDISATNVLRSLRRLNQDMAIIIYTVQAERRHGRTRRLDHIFEFIQKPSTSFELIGHIKRAMSYSREKIAIKRFGDETRKRIRQQLEWLIWTEHSYITDRINYSRSIVESIKHTTTQGNGVGSLITLVDMLSLDKKPIPGEEERYSISKSLLESMGDSAATVRNWLDELDTIARNLSKRYESATISGDQVVEMVREAIDSLDHFRIIKNHTTTFIPLKFEEPVFCNDIVLRLAVRELLTNAYKFSPNKSEVVVSFHRSSDSFSVVITNRIMPMSMGIAGIPEDFEQSIFEPFFKLNNIHDDRYQNEMYGMGTGLTIIQGAMNQIGGKIYVYESEDPHEKDQDRRVISELIFPIEQDEVL